MLSSPGDGSGEEPPPNPPPAPPSGLKEQFEQQQTLFTQMKDALLKNERQTSEKEKEAEAYGNKLSSIKSRSQRSQLLSPKPDDALQVRNMSPKDSKSSDVEKVTPSKGLTLLRQKVNENRVIFEQRGLENKRGVQVMVDQLKAQLDERDTTIREMQTSMVASPAAPHAVRDTAPVYEFAEESSGLPLSKDYQIAELSNKVIELEAVIVGLRENLLEKDSVIDARTKAISLMSEDLCRKSKSTVDQLEETREEMRRMQTNFIGLESDMKREKEELNRRLEAKSKRLLRIEEANKELDAIRSELTTRVSELQQELVNISHHTDQASHNATWELPPLVADNAAQQEKINNLESALADTNNELIKLKEKLDNTSHVQHCPIDHSAEQEKINELTSALDNATRQVTELRATVDDTSQEQHCPIDHSAEQEKINELTSALDNATRQITELRATVNDTSQEQQAPVDNTVEKDKLADLTVALSEANKQIIKLKAQTKKQLKQLNSLKKVSDANTKIVDLHNRIAELEEEKVSESSSKEILRELESQLATLRAESERHQNLIPALENEKRDFEARLTLSETQVQQLEDQLRQVEEMKVKSELRAVELEESIDLSVKEKLSLTDMLQALEGERADNQTIVASSLLEAKQHKDMLMADLHSELQEKIEYIQAVENQLDIVIGTKNASLEIWVKEIEGLKNYAQLLEKQLGELEMGRITKDEQFNFIESELLKHKCDVVEKDKMIIKLTKNLTAVESELEDKSNQVEASNKAQSVLTEKLRKVVARLKAKILEVNENEDKLNMLKGVLSEKDAVIAQLNHEKSLAKHEIDLMLETRRQLESEISASEQKHCDILQHSAETEERLQLMYDKFVRENSVRSKLETELNEREKEFLSCREEKGQELVTALDTISQLKKKNSELEAMNENNNHGTMVKDRKRVELESQLFALEQQFKDYVQTSDKESLTAKNTSTKLKKKLLLLEKTLSSLQYDLKEKDDCMQKLSEEKKNSQEAYDIQILDYNSQIASLHNLLSIKEIQLTECLAKVQQEQATLEDVRKSYASTPTSLETLANLHKQIAQNDLKLIAVHEGIAENERQYMQSLAASDAKLQEQQALTESLDAELHKSKDRIERLEASLEESNERQTTLEKKNADLILQLEESDRSRDKAVEEECILEEKLQGLISVSENVRLDLMSQAELNSEYCQIIADLKSKIPELEKNLFNAQNKLSLLQTENSRLAPFEQQLLKALEEMDKIRNEANLSLMTKEQTYTALKEELERANSNLDTVCFQFEQCEQGRRISGEKCNALSAEKLELAEDLEEVNNRLKDSLARIDRLEMDVGELGLKLNESEKLSRTFQELNLLNESKLATIEVEFKKYSSEAEQKLSLYEEEIRITTESLQEERSISSTLRKQAEVLHADYESELSALTTKNSQLKNLLCETETLKLLCEKEVSNIITQSKEHVGLVHSEDVIENAEHEDTSSSEPVSINLLSSWNESADEGWAWGTEEAKLEEEHQVVHQQKEGLPELANQLEVLGIKVSNLEAEKDKLGFDLKAAQVRNGKLLKKFKELKSKAEPNSLDLTMEKEFIIQISSLEKEVQMLKAEKESAMKEKQQLKYQTEALEWQISELSEDKSKMLESIDWCQSQILEKEEKVTESTSVIKRLMDDIKAITESTVSQAQTELSSSEANIMPQHSFAVESASLTEALNYSQSLELKLKESDEELLKLRLILQSNDVALNSLQCTLQETNIELDGYRNTYAQLELLYNTTCTELERLRNLEGMFTNDSNGSIRDENDRIQDHGKSAHELQLDVTTLANLLSTERQNLSDLHELFQLRDQEANNLKVRLEIRNEEIENMSRELQEHLNVIKLLKAVQDGHQMSERSGGDQGEDGSKELDIALYLLHQKEVRCDELTLELMQLLEERDTLQLRLSTSLRTNEELRRSDVSARSVESPSTPVAISPVPINQEITMDTTLGAEVLADKLDQLRSVGRQQRQMALQQQRVGSAALDANYTLSRDAQSTSETLLNWIWGRSTPKVVDI